MTASAAKKINRGFAGMIAEAALLAGSALMIVPFSWMVTVSLKERREVFSGSNFLPPVKVALEGLSREAVLIALLVAAGATSLIWIYLKTRKKGSLLPGIAAVVLWIAAIARAFASGILGGLVFDAYIDIWSRVPFARMFLNSTVVALAVTALQLVTSALAGFAFSRLQFPGRDRLFWAYAALMLIPQQATLIPAFMLIRNLGLMDTYAALILPFAAAPFGAFMMRQFFLGLPRELEEAAVLDGCSRLGVLFRIFMPLAKPGLATLGLFSFMTSWNEFLWPLMVTTKRDMFTLQVGLDMLKWEAGSDWPVIMAASVLVTIPVIAAFLLAQGRFTRSIAVSGINM